MPVYRDYEIRINLNELIEQRIPACNLTHPDHCLTDAQIADIAHDININGTMNFLELALKQSKSQDYNVKFFFPSSNSDDWLHLLQ